MEGHVSAILKVDMNFEKRCHIHETSGAVRLIDASLGVFPELPTRSSLKKSIKRGELYLNGKKAGTGDWVNKGDTIQYCVQERKREVPKSFPMHIPIVFEDDYLAVVYKPPGIRVSGNQYRTVTNALVGKLKLSSAPDAFSWGKPVHRLDVATSGLLVIAKTYTAHRLLGTMFENRVIEKTYCAIVQGNCKETQVESTIDGKYAKTLIQHGRIAPSLKNEFLSLLTLKPITGRTHQLRIHVARIGHPIVGDQQYGKEGNVMRHKGLFLAAIGLVFEHPMTGENMQFNLPIPKKFEALLNREQRRWKNYHGERINQL